MDPIKQNLIEAVGDLEASDRNVKAHVRANLTKKKRPMKRFFLTFATGAIIAILAFTFVFTLLPKDESIQTAKSKYSTEEQLAYLYEKMHEGKSTHPHLNKLGFITDVALPYFANYLGIQINQEELAKWMETEFEKEIDQETFKLLQKTPDYDRLINIYVTHYYTARYLEKEVLKKYEEMFPSLSKASREHLMQYEAISHFLTNENYELFAAREEIENILAYTDEINFGTIIDTEKNTITVAIGANYKDIEKLSVDQVASFHEVVKLPLVNKTAELGQYIQFSYMKDFSIERRNIEEIVPFSLAPAYIIFHTDEIQFETSFKQFNTTLDWSPHLKLNRLTNEYHVAIGDDIYLFAYNEQPIKLYNITMNEVATIPVEKTDEFINIIRKFIPELQ